MLVVDYLNLFALESYFSVEILPDYGIFFLFVCISLICGMLLTLVGNIIEDIFSEGLRILYYLFNDTDEIKKSLVSNYSQYKKIILGESAKIPTDKGGVLVAELYKEMENIPELLDRKRRRSYGAVLKRILLSYSLFFTVLLSCWFFILMVLLFLSATRDRVEEMEDRINLAMLLRRKKSS